MKNNIDELFKKVLQSLPEEDFREENWTLLEDRLDQEEKGKPKGLPWLNWKSIAAVAAIIVAISIYLFTAKNQLTETKNQSVLVSKPLLNPNQSDNANETTGRPLSYNNNNSIPNSGIKFTETKPLVKKKHTASLERDINTLNAKLENTNDPSSLLNIETIKQPLATNTIAQNLDTLNTTPQIAEARDDHSEIPLLENNQGITLSITAAPDFTNVKGSKQAKFSQNIGLLISKKMSSKLSIGSGVIYSWKNYTSPFELYQPKGNILLMENPTSVDAKCRILNIPIVSQISLLSSSKDAVKLGIGVSNYIMLNENYMFNYNNKYWHPYKLKTNNTHFLGTADISIVYERKIHNVTIGVQPFYQLPLKGVGYGQTNLESRGIAISLGVNLTDK